LFKKISFQLYKATFSVYFHHNTFEAANSTIPTFFSFTLSTFEFKRVDLKFLFSREKEFQMWLFLVSNRAKNFKFFYILIRCCILTAFQD